MSEELLPCPFCGSEDLRIVGTEYHWIECYGCGLSTRYDDNIPPIVHYWNTRTPARLESLKQLQQESEKMGLYCYGDKRHMSKDWSEEYYKEPTKLELKQRERREFVKTAVTNTLCDNSWNSAWEDVTRWAITLWNELDKQLTELEKKESEGE